MKTEALALHSWDDMVFENRHKEYGAYSIRQAYSRHMTVAAFSILIATLLIIFLPGLLPSPITDITAPKDPLSGPVYEPMPEPRIVNPKPQEQAAAPKSVSHQPPRVTRNEVTEAPPTVAQISAAPTTGSPDGVEGAAAFPTEGTGDTEAPVAPAIDPNKPFDIVEQMPAYEGGLQAMSKFISKNVKYPASARRMGIEGSVFVSFVVNSMGQIIDVKAIRGISADCDKEAERVIAMMPGWKAGVQNGIPVSVRMVLPIKFTLGN